MSNSEYELTYLNGEKVGEVIALKDKEITLGRSRSNGIVLPDDPLVSRNHVRITVADDTVMVHDLESSHGAFLNDKRIRGSVSLNTGDVLQVGNTQFRFSAPIDSEEEPRTAFVDSSKDQPMDSGATQFADGSSVGVAETAFAPQMDEESKDDSMEHTRVFAADETRIMEGAELKGLRANASPQSSKKTVLIGVLLLLLVVAALGVLMTNKEDDSAATIDSATRSYHERQYGFSLKLPVGWKRIRDAGDALLAFRQQLGRGDEPLSANVFVDRDTSFATTGLQAGFVEYEEILEGRYPKMRLLGKRVVTLASRTSQPIKAIHYGFTSETHKGEGMFLFDDSRRICVECAASANVFKTYASRLKSILASLRLDLPQRFIDFDLATGDIANMSLSDPARLREMAQHDLKIGEDLYSKRMVRQENLYLAIQSFKSCLTKSFALSDKPEFMKQAGRKLRIASTALDRAIRDQRLAIMSAESARDYKNAHWEAVRLTQLVPDKTSKTYQFAAGRIRRYSKIKTR